MAIRRKRNNHKRKDDIRFKYRRNFFIKVPEVRLAGDNMDEINAAWPDEEIKAGQVYPTKLLRSIAQKMELDLIEISPNAKPPVVRIIDFNKFIYDRKKREKELKAKQVKTVVKEIRFGPNTDDHDFNFKLRHAQGFLEEGNKVRAYVNFRGRTIVFKERGELLLLRFLKELEEFGTAEALPKMEGRRMSVMVAPKKVKKK